MIRAFIVDDEAPARREMRRLLEAHRDVHVTGEAGDVEAAARAIRAAGADVVFLDIRLGRASGFDLLPHLERDTAVVFVTAYDDYARRAFDAQALDYLMKPVDPARLADTIRRIADRTAPPVRDARDPGRAWIFIDDRERPELIRIETISHIVADGDRSVVHTTDGVTRSTPRSLGDWEDRLPGDFFRAHRSVLVCLRHVERIEPGRAYSLRIHLHGATEPVPLSRRRATALRQALG